MANQEHVAILKQGVETWNGWRKANPGVSLDLSGADPPGRNLSGADLHRANLGGTIDVFSVVDLSNRQVLNVGGADLNAADLSCANLSEANLTGADLSAANLTGTTLHGANLGGAALSETVFGETALTTARGLDSCRHGGPSVIDHRTLAKSGKLPIEFLRGCGLPDFIIDNVAVLQGDPVQFYSCFISYSTRDQEFADRLYADLQNKGIRCWFAPADMKIGDQIRKTIYDQIRVYEKLLLIFSEESVESEWVGDEVEAAFEEEKRRKRLMLFPIRLDDVVMETDNDWAAKIRRTRHIGDFKKWKDHDAYQVAFDRLIRDLQQEAEKGVAVKQGG